MLRLCHAEDKDMRYLTQWMDKLHPPMDRLHPLLLPLVQSRRWTAGSGVVLQTQAAVGKWGQQRALYALHLSAAWPQSV